MKNKKNEAFVDCPCSTLLRLSLDCLFAHVFLMSTLLSATGECDVYVLICSLQTSICVISMWASHKPHFSVMHLDVLLADHYCILLYIKFTTFLILNLCLFNKV